MEVLHIAEHALRAALGDAHTLGYPDELTGRELGVGQSAEHAELVLRELDTLGGKGVVLLLVEHTIDARGVVDEAADDGHGG